MSSSQILRPERYAAVLASALATLRAENFTARFLAKDPTLWKPDAIHARVVRNRMGWLDSARGTLARLEEITRFVDDVRREKFTHVVLLGMGGSSLCPDVLRRSFKRKSGSPALIVLDSTNPQMVRAVERAVSGGKPLFIVASKSGTTVESQMFYQHFAANAAPRQFAAITDSGTPLERLGLERGFRHIFINPTDIGGRYSALSCFGMVPAACMGIDVARLLSSGHEMVRRLTTDDDPAECAPVALGAMLGALGKKGRNKITFFASPAIATFGYWVEQLIAESTGKEGTGLVPVEGEPIGALASYGKDRLFVHLQLRGSRDTALTRRLGALSAAGHPTVTIHLADRYALGGEFNRWEIATATASSILGIDPFDEPNVSESKQNTGVVLQEFRSKGKLPRTTPDLEVPGVQAWVSLGRVKSAPRRGPRPLQQLMKQVTKAVRPGGYVAILAYLPMDPAGMGRLTRMRKKIRDVSRAAVTVGFGPRFLHSTGQLHKGGANIGVFIQITAENKTDLPIPGEPFSFGVLQAAQAAGDLQSLTGRGYRVVRLHLGTDVIKGLDTIIAAIPSR